MNDYMPKVARGRRNDEHPAPPRPTDDEMWEYVADHLRAIRASLGFLVFVAFVGALFGGLMFASSLS